MGTMCGSRTNMRSIFSLNIIFPLMKPIHCECFTTSMTLGGPLDFGRNAIPFSLNSSVYSVATHLLVNSLFRENSGVSLMVFARESATAAEQAHISLGCDDEEPLRITTSQRQLTLCPCYRLRNNFLFIQLFHFGHFLARGVRRVVRSTTYS